MTRMLEPASRALVQTDCPLLGKVGAAMTPGVSAGEAWQAVCGAENVRGGDMDALTREDREALNALFEHLGECGRQQQDERLCDAVRALHQNLEGARVRAGEAEKLYGSLGLLVGLMLALIVV